MQQDGWSGGFLKAFSVDGSFPSSDSAAFLALLEGLTVHRGPARMGLESVQFVQECILFNRLGLAFERKQMPRFVGNVNS